MNISLSRSFTCLIAICLLADTCPVSALANEMSLGGPLVHSRSMDSFMLQQALQERSILPGRLRALEIWRSVNSMARYFASLAEDRLGLIWILDRFRGIRVGVIVADVDLTLIAHPNEKLAGRNLQLILNA